VAMLVSVGGVLHWTPANLVSIFSKTRRSQYLFTKESITIIPSAVSLVHLRCAIQFRARGSRLMHGQEWARFSVSGKGTPFTHRDRPTPSLLMRRLNISAAKPKCSANLAPVLRSGSRDML